MGNAEGLCCCWASRDADDVLRETLSANGLLEVAWLADIVGLTNGLLLVTLMKGLAVDVTFCSRGSEGFAGSIRFLKGDLSAFWDSCDYTS